MEEGLDKVKVSIRNLKEFKTCFLVGIIPGPNLQIQTFPFQEYKVALPSYFTDQGKPARSWEFQEPLVFKRFDSFVERLHTMLEFFSTAVQVRNVS